MLLSQKWNRAGSKDLVQDGWYAPRVDQEKVFEKAGQEMGEVKLELQRNLGDLIRGYSECAAIPSANRKEVLLALLV